MAETESLSNEEVPSQDEAINPSPSRKHVKRGLFRLVACLILGYAAWCTVLYFYQDSLIFPADMAPEAPAGAPDPAVVVTRLDIVSGGQVESWFIPANGAGPDNPAPVVIFCHGNAEIIDYQDDIVQGYHKMGFSVLLPEYRGYGRAAGKPSEEGIVADLVRFHDELVKRRDVDTSRIVIHGRSLGGGVAAQLAARRKPAALILQSTFTSVAAMAHKYAAPMFLARHPFRTDRVVADIDVPLLIFHGSRDTIIPVGHGRALKEIARNAVYIEYNCGHNDFPGDFNDGEYWKAIKKFLMDNGVIK